MPLLALAVAVLLQGGAPDRASQVTVRVTPEAPNIGEAISVDVRVITAVGADIRFPSLPDSLQRVEALDPPAIRDNSTSGFVDRTATYRMIAFDTGQAALRIPDITLVRDGVESRLRGQSVSFRVRSVLPADSSGRIPRPPRGVLSADSNIWKLWLAIAVVLGLAAWAFIEWRARRRVRRMPEPAVAAEVAFAALPSLGLLDAGETGRYALSYVEVLRTYVAARFPQLSRSHTGAELARLTREADLPILPVRIEEIFARVEGVAFASAPIARADAESIAQDAVRIVADLETAYQARRARLGSRGRPRLRK